MKRLKVVILLTALSSVFLPLNQVSAASWGYNTNIYTFDNLGIGTSSPVDSLHIRKSNPGGGSLYEGKAYIGDGIGSWWIYGNKHSDGNGYNNIGTNAYFYNNAWFRRELNKEAWIISNYVTGNNTGYFAIFHSDAQNQTGIDNRKTLFSVNSNGDTRINGTLFTKEIKVTSQGWADYVFEDEYNLLSLGEVEHFINKNGHLPNIPSATEVEKNGISVGEMQRLQMEKIEELTLHLIEKDKQIQSLEERILKLEELIK